MSKPNWFQFRSLLLVLFLAVMGTACNDDAVAPNNTETTPLQGTVRDMNGYGISYAILEIHSDGTSVQSVIASDTADEEGVFAFGAVPRDMSRLLLRVTHPDFQPFTTKLGDAVRHLDSGQVRLSMQGEDSCCGQICITVVNADSSVVQGVQVKMRRGGRSARVGHTNAMGKAVFAPVCEGEYAFRIAKDGYQVVEQVITMQGCDSINTRIVLQHRENNDTCCNNRIKIVVRDSTTNMVLANTTVKIWKGNTLVATKTTNGDGVLVLEALCPGTYSFSIMRDGYTGRELSVTVSCNSNEERTVYLLGRQSGNDSCCNNRIKIVVRDSTTNMVLANTTVKIWKGNTLVATKTTNGDGKLILEELCRGTYSFSIMRDGYTSRELSVTVDCGSNEERTVYLLGRQGGNDSCCNNRIKIVVRDSTTNMVLANTTVKIWKGNTLVATKTSNADGVVVLEALCSGTYSFSIMRDGYNGRELSVTVSCNSNEERTVRMLAKSGSNDSCCNNRIKIVVRDSVLNTVLANTTVKIWKGNTLVATKTTNGDGMLVLEALCSGTYSFSILRDGFTGRELSVTVSCNSNEERTIRLLALQSGNDSCSTARLKIRVKDSTVANDGWLSEATVVVKRNGVVVAQGTTNAEGWYVREALLAPAEYSITISKQGYISKTIVFRFTECKTYQETVWLVPD